MFTTFSTNINTPITNGRVAASKPVMYRTPTTATTPLPTATQAAPAATAVPLVNTTDDYERTLELRAIVRMALLTIVVL